MYCMCFSPRVLLRPAPAKRDFIPAPFIEHFILTQMENKILIWDVCLEFCKESPSCTELIAQDDLSFIVSTDDCSAADQKTAYCPSCEETWDHLQCGLRLSVLGVSQCASGNIFISFHPK